MFDISIEILTLMAFLLIDLRIYRMHCIRPLHFNYYLSNIFVLSISQITAFNGLLRIPKIFTISTMSRVYCERIILFTASLHCCSTHSFISFICWVSVFTFNKKRNLNVAVKVTTKWTRFRLNFNFSAILLHKNVIECVSTSEVKKCQVYCRGPTSRISDILNLNWIRPTIWIHSWTISSVFKRKIKLYAFPKLCKTNGL